jgi:acetyl-CoA/propionyl-CoA carboxylase biotin carboxyl carrier protein
VRAAKSIGYDSAGTIEFLVSGNDFFFLEMNTRIQVEHTVTEMISGLDLVREQIRVAAGERLGYGQTAISFRGFSIEGRVNAEDPALGFRPAPGTITAYREPAGPGVRVDSAAYAGWAIPTEYDSLVAKLVVWAPTRLEAIARLRRAIDEYAIEGVPTTLPLLRALCDHPSVIDGTYGTTTLETFACTWLPTGDGRATSRPILSVATVNAAPRRTAPRLSSLRRGAANAGGNAVLSPMHGLIVELRVRAGDYVSEGDVVAVIEAMKMMNEIRAHKKGVVATIAVTPGATIEAGSALMTLAAP